MDTGPEATALDSLVVSGIGCVVSLPCSSTAYLRTLKNRKFMGNQDHLAVSAAGRALESAALNSTMLGSKAGLFLAVGFIPFERADIDALTESSLQDGRISYRSFGTRGFAAVNPLLTFRCLPNMPAYHISANFDVQGEYFVTYPGPGQLYLALQEAIDALNAGRIQIALVGAVADQTNFLVSHHFQRLHPPVPSTALRDGAGFLILETAIANLARKGPIRARVRSFEITYRTHRSLETEFSHKESFEGCSEPEGLFGAASLPITLASVRCAYVRHELHARDGISGHSSWEIL